MTTPGDRRRGGDDPAALRPVWPSPSPTVRRLLATGDPRALLRAARAAGGPLVEPDPHDAAAYLVTFVTETGRPGGGDGLAPSEPHEDGSSRSGPGGKRSSRSTPSGEGLSRSELHAIESLRLEPRADGSSRATFGTDGPMTSVPVRDDGLAPSESHADGPSRSELHADQPSQSEPVGVDEPSRSRAHEDGEAAVSGGVVLVMATGVVDVDRHAGDVSAHVLRRPPGADLGYATYRLSGDYRGSYLFHHGDGVPGCDRPSWRAAVGRAVPDRLNPVRVSGPHGRPASVLELPDAPPQPYRARQDGVPRGSLAAHEVAGRRIWLYLPPGHDAAGEHPVAVLLDGESWAGDADVTPTLDNLIADGAVPPMIAVLVDSISPADRWRDLTCDDDFARLLAGPLLSVAVAHGATKRPERTIVVGQSLGGLAAAHACLVAPERFGNALCQSGSFWWGDDEPRALVRTYAGAPRLPVAFHLQAGVFEPGLRADNDAFEAVLRERGYRVTRADHTGGHDRVCWLGGIADGLIELTRDW